MFRLRWHLSVLIWWLWLKITPNCTGKDDIVGAIAKAIIRQSDKQENK